MFAEINHSPDHVESEIVRCWQLSRDPACRCARIYESRAVTLHRNFEPVRSGRASPSQIETAALIVNDLMAFAPSSDVVAPEIRADVFRQIRSTQRGLAHV